MNEQSSTLQVKVPPNLSPGSEIRVQAPDGRTISAVIPSGLAPGDIFHVRIPAIPVVVQGQPVAQQTSGAAFSVGNNQQQTTLGKPKKYKRCSPEMILLGEKGLVKIKVPKGLKAGDGFNCKICDGRTISTRVPMSKDGKELTEFYVKVPPKKQNWHDNAVVAAVPMAVGPFLM